MAPPPLAHIAPQSSSSTPTQNTGGNSSSTRLLTPTTLPIPLLPHNSAQLYNLIHTTLIPCLYLLRASALVADPLRTLTYDIIPVATAQVAFCVLCLPSAGSWYSGTGDGKILEGTASRTAKGAGKGSGGSIGRRKGKAAVGAGVRGFEDVTLSGYSGRIMPAVLSLLLTIFVPPIPLTLLLLCLGAPIFPLSAAYLPLHLALSTHISLLAFLPLFYTHGVSGAAWREITAAWLPFDVVGVWGATVGCVVGAWMGAVPIALDWDRDWQAWPITIVWGCVLGWVVGRGLTIQPLALGVGARINFSEREESPRDTEIVSVGLEPSDEVSAVEAKKLR